MASDGIVVDTVEPGATPRCATALYGLSTLAVWWLRLGIQIERITPGTRNRTASSPSCTTMWGISMMRRVG